MKQIYTQQIYKLIQIFLKVLQTKEVNYNNLTMKCLTFKYYIIKKTHLFDNTSDSRHRNLNINISPYRKRDIVKNKIYQISKWNSEELTS